MLVYHFYDDDDTRAIPDLVNRLLINTSTNTM